MKPKLWLPLAAVSLLAACSPLTIIDAPADGATLPGNSYSIVVHTGVGVCVIEIQVEGKDPSLYTWQTSRQASGCGIGGTIGNPAPEQFAWTPPGPGTYTIKARGFLYAENQYGPWATAKVTVSDEPLTIGEIPDEAFGPQAWVDAPLDGSELPLAPYEVVAHASSPNGIASFEFSVNGVVVNPALVNPDQPGQTLAYVMFEWTPPAPGTYRLSVRAADANGRFGPPAGAFVTVGRGDAPPGPTATEPTPTESAPPVAGRDTPTPTDTPTGRPSPTSTTTPTRTPTFTSTPTSTSVPQAQVSFSADATALTAGQCTMLRWDVENATAVFLNGEGVVGHDTRQACPTTTTTYTLFVQAPSGDVSQSITINVSPPADTAAPTFQRVAAAPGIFYQGASRCGPNAVTISAVTSDPSGIGQVVLAYRMVIPGVAPDPAWQNASMSAVGGDTYQASLSSANFPALPRGADGRLEFYVRATDGVGNTGQSATDTSVTMKRC